MLRRERRGCVCWWSRALCRPLLFLAPALPLPFLLSRGASVRRGEAHTHEAIFKRQAVAVASSAKGASLAGLRFCVISFYTNLVATRQTVYTFHSARPHACIDCADRGLSKTTVWENRHGEVDRDRGEKRQHGDTRRKIQGSCTNRHKHKDGREEVTERQFPTETFATNLFSERTYDGLK